MRCSITSVVDLEAFIQFQIRLTLPPSVQDAAESNPLKALLPFLSYRYCNVLDCETVYSCCNLVLKILQNYSWLRAFLDT